MKNNSLLIVFLCFSYFAMSQENRFTLSGGYVFANIDETAADDSGWRINALRDGLINSAMAGTGFKF
jgi:hypothetical protein